MWTSRSWSVLPRCTPQGSPSWGYRSGRRDAKHDQVGGIRMTSVRSPRGSWWADACRRGRRERVKRRGQ
jgi:hypothetical protein